MHGAKKTGPYLMIMLICSLGSHAGCRHSNVHASHAIPYSIWRPAEKAFFLNHISNNLCKGTKINDLHRFHPAFAD